MVTWFVSRHPGAVEWAGREGFQVDRWVPHLLIEEIRSGDVVIGTLPVNMAAKVCARGAMYFNLSLNLPENWRGRELSADDLAEVGACLERFVITKEINHEI